jgi:putative transposase
LGAPTNKSNQLWEIDGTKGDIFAADGKRWTILQIIDVYSRRILSYVCETSSATNVIEGLLRKAFTIWGIPERIKLDNGKEFRSSRLEALCHHLEIEMDFCNFRSPEQKPAIERSFGTMTRDLLIRLPGFCGSTVAERQEIRSRNGEVNNEVKGVLTALEIQKAIEHWIVNEYEQRIHLGLGADTPMERWVKSPIAPRRILDERQLDILLAEPVGKNPIVQKKGIRVEKHWYTDELGRWVHWIGKEVQVRHDPMDDAGRVYVFSPDGSEFLFIADAPELTGASRAARVANAKAEQKTIKKIRKIHKDLAAKVMNADPALIAAKQAIARDKNKKVVPFERVTAVEAPTAVADAAQEVQNLLHLDTPPQQSPDQLEQQRIRRAIERQIAEKDAQRPPNEIFKDLAMKSQAGNPLSEDEREWLDRYRRTGGGAMLYSVYRNHFEGQNVAN